MKFRIERIILGAALLLGDGGILHGRTASIVALGATIDSFPECQVSSSGWIGDGECDGGEYNTAECGWDGGDCDAPPTPPGYPDCYVSHPESIGDGNCEGAFNFEECGWDGGDCEEFNTMYPDCRRGDESCASFNRTYPGCIVNIPEWVGDGSYCDAGAYNTAECDWDGGDCFEFNEKYPSCKAEYPFWLGNGNCNLGEYFTAECGWDGGDCLGLGLLVSNFPLCRVGHTHYDPSVIGNGICHGLFNNKECGWDGGDCIDFNEKYPDCHVELPGEIGNGYCVGSWNELEYSLYNSAECGWDGGDCNDFNKNFPDCRMGDKSCSTFNATYPGCLVDSPENLGNDYCDGGDYNTAECGWDGGDCVAFNAKYPECHVKYPALIGNWGKCNPEYNTDECGNDGGDCLSPMIENFPDCEVENPQYLGSGICTRYGNYNTKECGWDGGDCVIEQYPNCHVNDPRKIGDGTCDMDGEYLRVGDWSDVRLIYNNAACGWDGGDCLLAEYPECHSPDPSWVGDGSCHGGDFGYLEWIQDEMYYEVSNIPIMINTEECGWDGGDCELYNSLPECSVEYAYRIGDGYCNNDDEYNTADCGWDGGDCIVDGYPDCRVDTPEYIGDGSCDGGEYNTVECGWDGGDCVVDGYPDCHIDHPERIGDGDCNNNDEYNTAECGWDGGDCLEFNEKYPNCNVYYAKVIGNGECAVAGGDQWLSGFANPSFYYTEECGWDGGDCPTPAAFPNCHLDDPSLSNLVGNGICNKGEYNTLSCGWDGGDCIEANKLNPPPGWEGAEMTHPAFTDCHVHLISRIGDGSCDDWEGYNTAECGWEGGDCIGKNMAIPPPGFVDWVNKGGLQKWFQNPTVSDPVSYMVPEVPTDNSTSEELTEVVGETNGSGELIEPLDDDGSNIFSLALPCVFVAIATSFVCSANI